MMDLSMPGVGGIEATRRIAGRGAVGARRGAHVLRTTATTCSTCSTPARSGSCSRTAGGGELIEAIRSAPRGEAPLDPRAARAMLDRATRTDPREGMSAREREVLDLVGQGLPSKTIGSRLGISEATVKAHLTRVYRQIGVTDRTQAALWAREHPERGGPRNAEGRPGLMPDRPWRVALSLPLSAGRRCRRARTRLDVEAAFRVARGPHGDLVVARGDAGPDVARGSPSGRSASRGRPSSVAPPSSWNVIRPMFGPLVAMIPTMLPAEYVCLGDFALSPDELRPADGAAERTRAGEVGPRAAVT